MPRVTSQKQIDANRTNSQSSTGPTTRLGRLRSAANALRHGLLSQKVVINSGRAAENPVVYKALLRGFISDFKPSTSVERAIVERLAACAWRAQRLYRFESQALQSAADADSGETAVWQRRLSEHEALLAEQQQDLAELMYLQKYFNSAPAPDAESPQASQYQEHLLQAADGLELDTEDGLTDQLREQVLEETERLVTEAEMWVLTFERIVIRLRRKVRRLASQAKSGRLLSEKTISKLVRYEGTLDRQFNGLLQQLLGRRNATLQSSLSGLQWAKEHNS